MLLVLAHHHDSDAARLIARGRHLSARLLTCEDLSVAGWRYVSGQIHSGTAVASGRVVPHLKITGVLVRLPRVVPDDLPHIVPSDRAYVAGEMTAFLAAWLNELPCSVLNRPTPLCLLGPNWSQDHWAHAASRAGLSVCPRYREDPNGRAARFSAARSPTVQVTVIGESCLGNVEAPLLAAARRLACAANVGLLSVLFTDQTANACFAGATLCPTLRSVAELDAVLAWFENNRDRRSGPGPARRRLTPVQQSDVHE